MNIPRTTRITKCRLCFNNKLLKLYSFGNLFVSNFVAKKDINKGIKAPLSLVYCKNCKLLQLQHSAPQEIMYRKFYWYRSGITNTMNNALQDIFLTVKKMSILSKGDTILDIGANDGTLLKYYCNKNVKTIGCEPAKNLVSKLKKNCNYVLNDFWSYNKLNNMLMKKKLKKPKIITAIGMFYDLENPNKFIRDSALALDKRGIFIAQLMCLKSMIDKNDIGNICHEHIEFYSLKSLKYLFESNGLEIFRIEENNINGGSYRIFCRKLNKGSIKLAKENVLTSVKKFAKRVTKNKSITMKFINREIQKGKKIFISPV